jgi:hypothetical protein
MQVTRIEETRRKQSDKMASRDSIDGIEVAETSFNVNSDEYKGIKEETTDEDGRKHTIIVCFDM